VEVALTGLGVGALEAAVAAGDGDARVAELGTSVARLGASGPGEPLVDAVDLARDGVASHLLLVRTAGLATPLRGGELTGTGSDAAVARDGAFGPGGPGADFAVNRAGLVVAVLPLVEVVAGLALVLRLDDDLAGALLSTLATGLGARVPSGPSGKFAVDRLGVAEIGVLELDGTALGDGKVVGVLAGVLKAESDDFLAALRGTSEVFFVAEGSEASVGLAANFAGLAGRISDELAFAFAVNVVAAGVLALEFAVAVVFEEFERAVRGFLMAGFLRGVALSKSDGILPDLRVLLLGTAVEGHDVVKFGGLGDVKLRRSLVVDGDLAGG
jgi:hypothetical protein